MFEIFVHSVQETDITLSDSSLFHPIQILEVWRKRKAHVDKKSLNNVGNFLDYFFFSIQGWTKFYEFTFADLRAAADVIDRLLLIDHGQISRTTEDIWSWIHGLFGESIYGGRMDNTVDLSVLNSYLTSIFNDDTVRNRQLGPFKLPGTIELKV